MAAIAISCRSPQSVEDDATPEPVSPSAAPGLQQPEPPPGSTRLVYPRTPGSFVYLAEDVRRSVVALKSTRKVVGGPAGDFAGIDDEFALGTGFIIDSTGFIVTNDHVVGNTLDITVVLNLEGDPELRSERVARVVGRDPKLDIALLSIDGASRLTPLPLGDSKDTQVGEWVMAAGNAFGDGVSVSAGIVSRLPTSTAVAGENFYRAYIHTDADIHSGNSGGPLVNMAGEVIGINVAVERRGARIGYAIPIHHLDSQYLDQLKVSGTVSRAWLGAWVKPVTPDVARLVGLDTPMGALVTGTVKGSPAERAGLRQGDVVLQYDDKQVDERSLPWVVATTGIGRRIAAVVWRKRGEITLEVVSEKMPD